MSEQLVIRPDDGTTFQLGAIAARTIVDATKTNGGLAIVEAPIAPKMLAGPLHTHHNEDALWYVLEGEFAAQVGEREFHEGPGTVVLAAQRFGVEMHWDSMTTLMEKHGVGFAG